jgi:molecular chaperone DnaK (HSP70)
VSATRTDRPFPLVVGIDLGTTNSALAWSEGRAGIRVFAVPQLVGPGEVGHLGVLPSFLYLPTDGERASGSFRTPWEAPAGDGTIVGAFAREHGALVPLRQIASAKSWLANPSVDRGAAMLPWGVETGPRLSPVEASACILRHLRDAWNHEHARGRDDRRLERQSIVLTVPASFDEEARELTVQAVRSAGFTDLRLLEEPQAALYAWIGAHLRTAGDRLAAGDTVLVCDVGGGTTDFTLIRVSADESGLRFERIAVGEHLLLGGDNLDLALALLVEQKLVADGGAKLTLTQRQILRRRCNAAKEQLLSQPDLDRVRLTLLGAGRGVVAGGMAADLTTEETVRALEEGFLPIVAADDLPVRDRRTGLRELGLPYEPDPAITKHLAAFLARAARASGQAGMVRPDVVLFNGGFFAPAITRERVLATLGAWFGDRPRVLVNARPEAAVAVGAAFYARLRQQPELAARLLIRAGAARAYYVGVRTGEELPPHGGAAPPVRSITAVCVLPRGTQEGTSMALDRDFTVLTNKPVAFALYSTTQREDALNDVVTLGAADEAYRHAPLVTVLRYGKRSRSVPISVRLRVLFTETGTLELWCESAATDHRWRLSFGLRGLELDALPGPDDDGGTAGEDDQVVIDPAAVARAAALIDGVFGPQGPAQRPDALTGEIEAVLGHGKHAWPLATARHLADALLRVEPGRHRSPELEARWLNLAGFCTRPGFGTPLDQWRLSELRRVYAAGLTFPRDVQCQVEWLVLWQRVAAGFSTGQQRELAQRVMGQLGIGQRKPLRVNPQIEREGWRLLASLERLDSGLRVRLGDELLERLRRDARNGSWLWGIARLGCRVPFHGPLTSVVPAAAAEGWLARLLTLKVFTSDTAAAVSTIGALTGDAARDISDDARRAAIDRVRTAGFDDSAIAPLLSIQPIDAGQATRAFGESLPDGLQLDATTAAR